jgi:addiction module HigA family antidote
MLPTHRPPTHPGEVLQEEFLKPLGISQAGLAHHLGCSAKDINRIIKGHVGLSAAMAWRLADVFRTSPEFWMNLQNNYTLWKQRPRRRLSPLVKAG